MKSKKEIEEGNESFTGMANAVPVTQGTGAT